MKLTFYGGVGTVTGSRTLVEAEGRRILVDCGLYQGFKNLRLRNREPFPIDPKSIDAVVLTHAHIDHSGYLPKLVKDGFSGEVYCTPGTRDLCSILLPDCAHIQMEEAGHANRHGYSKHRPATPLYTYPDAQAALERIRTRSFHHEFDLGGSMKATFHAAGHILGASFLRIEHEGRTLTFSGDVGRPDDLVMRSPEPLLETDFLVLESTYGDRKHPTEDVEKELAAIINRTVERRGVVLIPSFAVGRAQALLYLLYRLKKTGAIPSDLPIYLDSPMATTVTDTYRQHENSHRLSRSEAAAAFSVAKYVGSREESMALDQGDVPKVIVSASGMVTGGRILHHVVALATEPRNTILFVGYQAPGTRGASLRAGEPSVKIFGNYVSIQAEVDALDSLSAHADSYELLDWIRPLEKAPVRTFINHGEPSVADRFRRTIEEKLGWACTVPDYRDQFDLEEISDQAAASHQTPE